MWEWVQAAESPQPLQPWSFIHKEGNGESALPFSLEHLVLVKSTWGCQTRLIRSGSSWATTHTSRPWSSHTAFCGHPDPLISEQALSMGRKVFLSLCSLGCDILWFLIENARTWSLERESLPLCVSLLAEETGLPCGPLPSGPYVHGICGSLPW